jgi:photosystem II stability/assembly factor-like uncharacterized protein
MMKTACIILFTLFTCNIVYAQWESLNGPAGDGVSSLLESGTDLLVSTYTGIFRSSDGGEHWQAVDNELRGIDISTLIRQRDTLFAYSAVEKALFRSEDEGEHFQMVTPSNLSTYVFHQLIATDSALFLLDPKLKRSLDGGTTWEDVSFPAPLQYYYTQMYVQGSTLYVVAPSEGIYKTDDHGNSWTLLTGNLSQKPAWGFVFEGGLLAGFNANGWKIFRSFNDGLSWSNDQDPGISLGFTVFGADNDHLYAVRSGELWRSAINGNSWSIVSEDSFLSQTNVPIENRIKFYNLPNQLLATSYEGLFRSSNKGENWQELEEGLVNVGIRDVMVYHETVICAGYTGLYRMPLSGEWSEDLSEQFPISKNLVLRLSEIEEDLYAGAKWKLYRSIDTGQTWQAASPFLIDFFTEVIKVGNDLVSASSFGIWRSSDDGISWMHSSEGLGYIDWDIEVHPFLDALIQVGDTLLTSGSQSWLYRSTDGGYHWEVADSIFSGRRIYYFDDQLFLVTNYQVYRSNDSGASWQPVNFSHPNGVNCMARIDSLYFAGTMGGVLVSKDKGYTWAFADSNFPDNLWVSSLDADHEYLYAGTAGEGVWRRRWSNFLTEAGEPLTAPGFQASLVKNPVREVATVRLVLEKSGNSHIYVFDAAGRMVREQPGPEKMIGEQFLTLNLNGLPAGVYTIAVVVDGIRVGLSVVKE